ncbi:hypothetical protein N781_09955 [Pontibacillus halophilus JSM 076056 = DSM 19796]|uniref:Sporulation membrane protein YtrI C-terminal domain-containing protein n=1 Tax=Pontibacillus halophilus JSM 076056 = DSM 19796 TaxID=1385510 RepID=A0A0A5GQC2_9BACI|nr:sporulation membrane protein YtrI [Pontibacillus halophilus]KGX93370.1 hypothetical protein N781_09955 [Pontibacillus halophilus JSM 076056 = DSM 19796]
MHIPPYYKRPSWQRFFAGVFIGGIVAFGLFLYMYGSLAEKWVEENLALEAKVKDLEFELEVLNKDKEEMNKEQKELVTIQEIEVNFTNDKELKLDRLISHQLKEMIKNEIRHVIGQSIQSISDSRTLLISAIQHKKYEVDDLKYNVHVDHLTIGPTLSLSIKLSVTSSP